MAMPQKTICISTFCTILCGANSSFICSSLILSILPRTPEVQNTFAGCKEMR
jgi:hypothetical protein